MQGRPHLVPSPVSAFSESAVRTYPGLTTRTCTPATSTVEHPKGVQTAKLTGAATAHQGTRSARGALRVRLLLRAPRAHDEDATLPRRASSTASASDVTSASPPPVPLRANKTPALLASLRTTTDTTALRHTEAHSTHVRAHIHTDGRMHHRQRAGTHAHTDRLPPTRRGAKRTHLGLRPRHAARWQTLAVHAYSLSMKTETVAPVAPASAAGSCLREGRDFSAPNR
jgi:hypothetical protein